MKSAELKKYVRLVDEKQSVEQQQQSVALVFNDPVTQKVITDIPFVIPFADRVRLFRGLVEQDRATSNANNPATYQLSIRRSRVSYFHCCYFYICQKK